MIITLAEYERRHGFSHDYLTRLARDGRLPQATKVGGTWLIDKSAPLPERRKYKKERN